MLNNLYQRIKSVQWFNKKRIHALVALLMLAIVLFLLTFTNVRAKIYDIEQFEIADETILSPITIEDKQQTDEKKSQAFQSVDNIYTIDESKLAKQLTYIEDIFKAVNTIEEKEKNDDVKPDSTEELVKQLDKMLADDITSSLDTDVFEQLLKATKEQRDLAKELLVKEVTDVMETGVEASEIEETTENIQEQLHLPSFDDKFQKAINEIAAFAIVENNFLDASKTSQAKNKAANEVEPVMIRQGQVLVSEGERITSDVFHQIELVGLLDNKSNMYRYIGLSIIILLSMAIIAYEMYVLHRERKLHAGVIYAIVIICTMSFVFMKFGSLFQDDWAKVYFAVPLGASAFLLKILIDERMAIVVSVVSAVFATVFFNQQIPGTLNLEAGIYVLFSTIFAVLFLANSKDRTYILKAGLGVTVVNVTLVVMLVFLSYELIPTPALWLQILFAITSAFLASVLTFGLLPFFETGFGILSDSKLITLANPNHPLLRKILTETPGTYHHSVMVANLSEAACESIGANGLIARVGAYYHDLGKTYNPLYFIENQMGAQNPHELLTPEQSAEMIIEHPYAGARVLRKHHMPQQIIDIAEQHHGTTLLKYFYYQAKEKDESVSEDTFRYPGPKPQTREAAVVCICDSVEAAVRSLDHPTPEDIEQLVNSIITDRLLDGQLNECSLTLEDLKHVQITICETLKGIFHSRIQYPDSMKTIKEAN
ncbi:HD family phosphohydrolase [Pontibacillus litoralis]|uniref:Membrane protein n=1 Tax=Pontibacillus litoralis JSM 072002 TaxID=1385512 RepID=A0A0A5GCJ3_9BACI|nr:HDIG domain-containing metalloprotein [Pontibacillus litoralis]KGX88913.1 membrane protein [Pontibacillus litoralis JSM 072002]